MMILIALSATLPVTTAARACAIGGGNGYTASLIAPVVVEAPPPKPIVVAKPKPKPKPHPKRANLSLGCASHKKH